MSELPSKKVDESWKEQVEKEKAGADPVDPVAGPAAEPRAPAPPPASGSSGRAGEPAEGEGLPEARFDLFVSGLAIDALIAMGDVPHPVTKKSAANLPHARYLIDLLGILEEKTRGNLSVDEDRLLKDTLYQLRMRYLAKTGG